MNTKKKQYLIDQLQEIRSGNDVAKRVYVSATSGVIEIKNSVIINNVIDYLIKELRDDVVKEISDD